MKTAENLNKTILDAENEVFFDGKRGKLIATPNARLRSGDILLIAKRIELDQKQNEAVAIGNVILSDGEFRLLCENMQINLISGDFNATNVKFGIYPWAIQAEEISRTKSIVQGLESGLYFLGKEKYEPNLKIRKLKLDQEKDNVDASGYLSLGSVVSYVPVSALATLVIFIGASLIKARQIQAVSRATRSDAITFSVTLFVGLLFSLQMAIFAGVVTSILLFLRKVAEPEMVEYGYNEAGELAELSTKSRRPEPEVSIVHVEGELFFAAADLFYEQIRRVGEDPNLRVLVLKLLNAHHLDATSVMALEELLDYLKEKNCHVLLCGVRRDVLRIIRNAGVLSRMNRKNIFPHSASNPTLSTAKAIKRAKYLTSGEQAKVTIFAEQKMN